MKSTWMKGTVILTASAFFVKIFSLVYKVPYQNISGDEGLYVFQQVYPLIGIYMSLNSVVLPSIVSELLLTYQFSEDIKTYIKRSLWIFGTVCFVTLFLGSHSIARLMGDAQLVPLIQIIAFTHLLLPTLSYWRAVAQSKTETINFLAYSLTLEQLVRVAVILTALFVFSRESVYETAQWAYLGGFIAPLFAVIFLLLCPIKDETGSYLKLNTRPHFFKKSIFLFLSAGILILFQLIDSFFVFNALIDSQIPPVEAMALKGSYDRGLPLIQSATVFTSAIVSSMIPQLAIERELKKRKKLFNGSLRLLLMASIPATVGLFLVLPDLNVALFTNNLGIEALQLLVLQVLFYPFIVFSSAMLQSEGQYSKLIIAILSGLAVKLLGVYFLTLNGGIIGAALSSVLGFGVVAICQIVFFRRMFSVKVIQTLLQVGVATLAMWMTINLSESFLLNSFQTFTNERVVSFMMLAGKVVIGILTYAIVMGVFMIIINTLRSGRRKSKKKKQVVAKK